MKVTKAIEINRDTAVSLKTKSLHDAYLALLLAIAALERHRDRDYLFFDQRMEKLPGED